MSNVIRAESVSKSYPIEGGSVHVLKQISLSVEKGSVFGIMGESGAGKSTLLNILSTLDPPDQGTVEVMGESIYDMNPNTLNRLRNHTISFIYQFHHLLPEFDVRQNVMMPSLIRSNRNGLKQRAEELLTRVGLDDRMTYAIRQLSGGEQQRVAIARALMNQPKIIFCDEPTGNLDHKNTVAVFEMFRRLANEEGITFVIVSHSAYLKSITDQMIQLQDGQIL